MQNLIEYYRNKHGNSDLDDERSDNRINLVYQLCIINYLISNKIIYLEAIDKYCNNEITSRNADKLKYVITAMNNLTKFKWRINQKSILPNSIKYSHLFDYHQLTFNNYDNSKNTENSTLDTIFTEIDQYIISLDVANDNVIRNIIKIMVRNIYDHIENVMYDQLSGDYEFQLEFR